MTQYLSQQRLFYLLVGAFGLGFSIGAVYQIFRIRRAAFEQMKIPRWISAVWLNVEDFLFLLAVGCAVTILFYALSGGVVRLMVFPVMGCGLLCWRKTVGRLIDRATQQILRMLARILRWIRGKVLRPIGQTVLAILRRLGQAMKKKQRMRYEKRLWKLAEKETLRYGQWLNRVLSQGGSLNPWKPIGKNKG